MHRIQILRTSNNICNVELNCCFSAVWSLNTQMRNTLRVSQVTLGSVWCIYLWYKSFSERPRVGFFLAGFLFQFAPSINLPPKLMSNSSAAFASLAYRHFGISLCSDKLHDTDEADPALWMAGPIPTRTLYTVLKSCSNCVNSAV